MTDLARGDAVSARERQDELMRAALATGATYAAAGTVAGVSERTVRRRMGDPRFAAEVSVRRGEQVATVSGLLVNAGADAVQVLSDSLRSDSEAVRLRAAHLILTVGTQLRHAHELEERLGALEARRLTAAGAGDQP
jgi:hypothetical protein